MIDVVGEAIPNWIVACTSFFTLVAAIFAGVFAKKAAHWTEKQAHASNDQVQIARDALEVARAEAKAAQDATVRQAEEAQATYRRYEESKLDAIIPVILATVRRPSWLIETKPTEMYESVGWTPPWEWFTDKQHFDESQRNENRFRIRLNVLIENVSPHTARVDITNYASGEVIGVPPGEPLIVAPGRERVITWIRDITADMWAAEDQMNDPEKGYFNLTLWVRDLGMNVRDTYKFNSDLRVFDRDGSGVVLRPAPDRDWTESVAQPLQQRFYERLEKNRTMTVNYAGSGVLASDIQKNPA